MQDNFRLTGATINTLLLNRLKRSLPAGDVVLSGLRSGSILRAVAQIPSEDFLLTPRAFGELYLRTVADSLCIQAKALAPWWWRWLRRPTYFLVTPYFGDYDQTGSYDTQSGHAVYYRRIGESCDFQVAMEW